MSFCLTKYSFLVICLAFLVLIDVIAIMSMEKVELVAAITAPAVAIIGYGVLRFEEVTNG